MMITLLIIIYYYTYIDAKIYIIQKKLITNGRRKVSP